MHTNANALQYSQDSQQYKGILALKAERRFSPNDFLTYFDRISASVLYIPSFLSELHKRLLNLPSESFALKRDSTGIGYVDLKPVLDEKKRLTRALQEITPFLSGYINFLTATGIPIPDPTVIKREDIVNRVIKMGYFDTKTNKFIYGTAFVDVEWSEQAEDIWSFNRDNVVGTNPIIFKWCDSNQITQTDIVFEFISSIK